MGNEDWLNTFGHPSSGLEGIIVSIYNLGAFSGCILTFLVGERLGRRLCMWVAMIWIVSWRKHPHARPPNVLIFDRLSAQFSNAPRIPSRRS